MDYIYGKLNNETLLAEYTGITTQTARTIIDNKKHTIQVEVLGGTSSDTGALSFNKQQDLSNTQLNVVRDNIKLDNYINNHTILKNSPEQLINGSLGISGNLYTNKLISNGLITLNKNGSNSKIGLLFNNYTNGKNATLTVDELGDLKFINESGERTVMFNSGLDTNKFVKFDGNSLTSTDIEIADINISEDYEPVYGTDLVTKKYIENAIKYNSTYKIIQNVDDINYIDAYEGRRILVLEEDI